MAGWRAGFVVGNKEILASLARIKTNLDYGLFMATQRACIAALNLPDEYLEEVRNTYKRRRDIFSEGLFKLGWQFKKPQAAMYLWVPIPKNFTSSKEFAQEVLRRTGVVIAAGNAFGSSGEGFVRIALVDREERLQEAVERMEKAGIRY
jgi:LL-diaminopimelate aminotransferase